MRLVHQKWNQQITLDLNVPTTLIFDKTDELFVFLKELTNEFDSKEETISLTNYDKSLNFSKEVEVISNIFDVSLNTKKTINALYKELESTIKTTDLLFRFNELKSEIISFLGMIKKETLFDLNYDNDITLNDFLKITNVMYTDEIESVTELIIKYFDISLTFNKTKVVFIAFINYFLSKIEVEEIIEYMKNRDIYMIFIEKEKPKNDIFSNVALISDNCVIL